jgi:glutamine amidotransferase
VRIAVIAIGVGNVRSVVRALEEVVAGAKEISVTRDPDLVRSADALVVPGQGSFGAFTHALGTEANGLDEVLVERIRSGVPYLGICLGLQVLFESSDEAPGERGLAIFAGRVRRLTPANDAASGRPLPLPHIGWNRVEPCSSRASPIADAHYYFAHSYAAMPDDATLTAATTDYGGTFTSAVHKDNVLGVQFHPEKSQRAGLDLLARFFAC